MFRVGFAVRSLRRDVSQDADLRCRRLRPGALRSQFAAICFRTLADRSLRGERSEFLPGRGYGPEALSPQFAAICFRTFAGRTCGGSVASLRRGWLLPEWPSARSLRLSVSGLLRVVVCGVSAASLRRGRLRLARLFGAAVHKKRSSSAVRAAQRTAVCGKNPLR